MNKPSEKATQFAEKWETTTFLRYRLAKLLDTHTADAIAPYQKALDDAAGAINSLLGHLDVNFNDTRSCWVEQGKQAIAKIAKLRKE